MIDIIKKIEQIIESDIFYKKMEQINYNYPNLKQEIVIRNAVLELFNDEHKETDYRAFAEYPRNKEFKYFCSKSNSEKIPRFDLSIIKKTIDNLINKNNIFKIEFKFFFTNDKKNDEYEHNL